MRKVDDQHQLDKDETKPANHAKVHPSRTERAMGDEERAHDPTDDDQVFEPPESILQAGTGVTG